MYSPKSLPRKACPGKTLYVTGQKQVKAEKCTEPVLDCGFCQKHKHIADLLNQLDAINYARLHINQALTLGGDVEAWEEVLLTVPPRGQWALLNEATAAEWRKAGKLSRYDEIVNAIEQYKRSHNIASHSEVMKRFEEIEPEYSRTNRILARM